MDYANKYVVSLKFDDILYKNYIDIKNFEKTSQQRQIEIYALPGIIDKDSTIHEDIYKTQQQANFDAERDNISSIMFIEGGQYEVVNFIDEVKFAYTTYGDHDLATDLYIFEDSFSPMYAFTYVTKMYSKILNYVKEFQLYKFDESGSNKTLVFDFLNLK